MSLALTLHPRHECVRCLNRQSNTAQSSINIYVKDLSGTQYTYTLARDAKVVELIKRLQEDAHRPADQMLLTHNRYTVSLFSEHLSDYIQPDANEAVFYMKLRLGHWSQTAKEYPVILQAAIGEGVHANQDELGRRFISLFSETLQEAMNTL